MADDILWTGISISILTHTFSSPQKSERRDYVFTQLQFSNGFPLHPLFFFVESLEFQRPKGPT